MKIEKSCMSFCLLFLCIGCAFHSEKTIDQKALSQTVRLALSKEKVDSFELRKVLLGNSPDLRISRLMIKTARFSPSDPSLRYWIANVLPFQNPISVKIDASQDILSGVFNFLLSLLGLYNNPALELAQAKHDRMEVELSNKLELLLLDLSVLREKRKRKLHELSIELDDDEDFAWFAQNLFLQKPANDLRTCRDRVRKARQELEETESLLRYKTIEIYKLCGAAYGIPKY